MTEEEKLEQEQDVQNEPEFSEMDIRPGMMVEVMTVKNILTFVGRVRAFNGKILTIKEATDGELPPVLFNQDVKLRFFQRNKTLVLHGQVCGSTEWIWRVDRLESQFGAEQRMFFRQNVNLKAEVALDPEDGSAGPAAPCTVLDISVGGLLINCRKIFEEGDRVSVTGASIVKELGPFSFRCCVQRTQKSGPDYLYGCKFEELTPKEEDRLLQAIFIAQRKDIHKQRDRGI